MDHAQSAIRTAFPTEVWVEAQVISVRPKPWGGVLDLIEPQADNTVTCARLSCTADHDTVVRISEAFGFDLDPALLIGTVALLKVRVNFHHRYQLGLRLVGLDPNLGQGLLGKKADLIRATLAGEGIFGAQHRLAAPRDVTRLVVIHPDRSASWSDVEAELQRWQTSGILSFETLPAIFEGTRAISSLVRALERARDLAKAGDVDLVMVLRGGGDPTGLASLSDEDVARGLLAIPVPVITGLGHARDRTLLDEVAWRAADTPSKAIGMVRTLFAEPARTAIRHWTSIHHDLDRLIRFEVGPDLERTYERLVQATGPMLQAERAGLEGLRSVVEFRRAGVIVEFRQLERDLDACVQTLAWDAFGRPLAEAEHLGGLYQAVLQDARSRIDCLDDLGPRNHDIESNLIALFRRQGTELVEMLTRAEEGMRQALLFANADLAALHATVQALDAGALLARGFVLAVDAKGAIVKSAADAALLGGLSLLFADGELAVLPTKSTIKASVH